MEKQKKNQNKWQQKQQFANYKKIKIDLTKQLGFDIPKEKLLIIPIFIPHLGCKNECIFCNQRKISGHGSNVDIRTVREEIEKFLELYKGRKEKIQIAFFGGSFTGLEIKEQISFLSLANEYIDKGLVKDIRISTRPDYITEEILCVLKKYNVRVIELGVQSMDKEVLKIAKRGHSAQDVITASKMIVSHGFILGHQMILGLPQSTLEKELNTLEKCIKLKPKYLRIYPLYVLRESKLYEMYERKEYIPISLKDMVDRTSKIYLLAVKHKLNVIRIGLQTTEEINETNDEIIGPVTNNYRERVLSNISKNEVIKKLEKQKNSKKDIQILTPKKQINYIVGYKQENVKEYEAIVKKRVIIKSI